MCRTPIEPLDGARAARLLAALDLEEKRALRRPGQPQWRSFFLNLSLALGSVVDRLAGEEIDAAAWRELTGARLEDGHVRATTLGRQRAGDLTDRNVVDLVSGRARYREDAPYLDRFAEQIAAGKYDDGRGGLRTAPMKQRLELYAQRTRGTANEAFAHTSGDDLFDWVMLAAEHCEVCPTRQAGSPYTAATLPSYPGDGRTPCLANCGCVLVRHDGVIGFARVLNTSV